METVLEIAVLVMAGLTGLLMVRVFWVKSKGREEPLPPLFFCLWIVSTAVWNTYFFTYRLPGLFDVSIERVLFAGMVMSTLVQLNRRAVSVKADHAIEIWMGLFLCLGILSMSINGFEAIHPAYPKPWFIFFSSYLAPFAGFFYAKYFLRDSRAIRFVMLTFFVLGVYLCLTAFFERAGLNALVIPSYILDPKVTLHLDRARGPFLNAAFNGLGMVIGFIGGVYLLPRFRGGRRLLMLILLGLYFPGVFLTYTRSAYLGFVLVLTALLLVYRSRKSKWKFAPIIVSLALLGLAFNSDRLMSSERAAGGLAQMKEIGERFELIDRSMRLFSQYPFFGVGLAHFTVADSSPEIFQDQQHNHLIGMAVELGLFGAACYMVILTYIFRRLYQLANDPANDTVERANQIILLCAAFSVNLITNMFVEPAYCPFINVNTFVFAGIIERIYDQPDLLEGPEAEAA